MEIEDKKNRTNNRKNIKLKHLNIVKEFEKLFKKIWDKIQKVLVYLYPEIEKIPKKTSEQKIKLNRKDIIKLILLALFPMVITVSYIYLPLKAVNTLLLSLYVLIVAFKTIKTYKKDKKLNKKIIINIIIVLIMMILWTYTIFN